MAISFVNAADLGNNGGSGNFSASYTVGSGSNRLLLVFMTTTVGGNSDPITSVTYNGVSMTRAVAELGGASSARLIYIYYLLNPAAGSNTVAINQTGGDYILAGAADYAGVAQSGQPDSTNSVEAGVASTSTLATTVVAPNSWVVTFGSSNNSVPDVTGGGTRRALDGSFDTWVFGDSGAAEPAGSYSMSVTWANGTGPNIKQVIASFAPAGPDVTPAWGAAGAQQLPLRRTSLGSYGALSGSIEYGSFDPVPPFGWVPEPPLLRTVWRKPYSPTPKHATLQITPNPVPPPPLVDFQQAQLRRPSSAAAMVATGLNLPSQPVIQPLVNGWTVAIPDLPQFKRKQAFPEITGRSDKPAEVVVAPPLIGWSVDPTLRTTWRKSYSPTPKHNIGTQTPQSPAPPPLVEAALPSIKRVAPTYSALSASVGFGLVDQFHSYGWVSELPAPYRQRRFVLPDISARFDKPVEVIIVPPPFGWTIVNPTVKQQLFRSRYELPPINVWAIPPVAPPPSTAVFACAINQAAMAYSAVASMPDVAVSRVVGVDAAYAAGTSSDRAYYVTSGVSVVQLYSVTDSDIAIYRTALADSARMRVTTSEFACND